MINEAWLYFLLVECDLKCDVVLEEVADIDIMGVVEFVVHECW